MKILIRFPHLPRMELAIESDLAECCALLLRLGETGSTALKPAGEPAGGNPEPAEADPAHVPRPMSPPSGRLYRGRLNRRQMVIQVFEELERRGKDRVKLEDVKTCFAEMFPEEAIENLAQVVRDLANKTEILERCEWGTFRLS